MQWEFVQLTKILEAISQAHRSYSNMVAVQSESETLKITIFRNWLVMLKPNLPKRCFTTTLMDRLTQFSTSQDSMQICKHSTLRSQTRLYGLWVVDMLRQEFCWFTSHNTGCSVSVWKQMAITYKKASIVQKLPSRNSSFILYFIAFSAGYLVIYMSVWMHGPKQNPAWIA